MITTKEMQKLEDKTVKSGVSVIDLMENAGSAVAKTVDDKYNVQGKTLLVVCYHGNNGGDGFVAANKLSKKAEVDVLFIGDESRFKPEALANFNLLKQSERIQFISLEYVDFTQYDIIIDAMLGTGADGELKYPIGAVIELINQSKAVKVSLDIPTGLDPDTGKINSKFVEADSIITLHDIKKGLSKYKNKVIIVDIGIKV